MGVDLIRQVHLDLSMPTASQFPRQVPLIHSVWKKPHTTNNKLPISEERVNKKHTHQPYITSGSLTENTKLSFMHMHTDVSQTKGRK
jgi:hypothetical protein